MLLIETVDVVSTGKDLFHHSSDTTVRFIHITFPLELLTTFIKVALHVFVLFIASKTHIFVGDVDVVFCFRNGGWNTTDLLVFCSGGLNSTGALNGGASTRNFRLLQSFPTEGLRTGHNT